MAASVPRKELIVAVSALNKWDQVINLNHLPTGHSCTDAASQTQQDLHFPREEAERLYQVLCRVHHSKVNLNSDLVQKLWNEETLNYQKTEHRKILLNLSQSGWWIGSYVLTWEQTHEMLQASKPKVSTDQKGLKRFWSRPKIKSSFWTQPNGQTHHRAMSKVSDGEVVPLNVKEQQMRTFVILTLLVWPHDVPDPIKIL